MKVDFPTFGKPINPTSAKSFNSNITSFSIPFSPPIANLGACLVDVAKCELPFPPLPPGNNSSFWPSFERSAITLPVSASFTIVPIGTFIIISSPLLPYLWPPSPFLPSSALNFFLNLKSINVFWFGSTSKYTSPPFPPSPPSGPPAATYFSLLNDIAPSPPFPDLTKYYA